MDRLTAWRDKEGGARALRQDLTQPGRAAINTLTSLAGSNSATICPVGDPDLGDPQILMLELAHGMLIDTETYIDCPYRYWRVAQVPVDGRLGDDDRTSVLLILASSVDPNLASTCGRVVLSSNDPQPHDQAQRHSEGGQGGRRIGVVSCGWSLGWRHADRDQFGPRIRLR